MRRSIHHSIGITLGSLIGTLAIAVCPALTGDQEILVSQIETIPSPEGETVQIHASRPFDFVTYTLTNPDRLVIDPVEHGVGASLAPYGLLKGNLVRSWRLVPAGSSRPGEVDYVELVLSEPAQHRLLSRSDPLTLQIRPKALEPPAEPLPPTAAEPPPPLVAEPRPPDPPAGEVWDFRQSLVFGLGRHRPLRVARKEVDLSQGKVREAKRALYPTATLRLSWTEGTASDVNFREYNTGLQFEQPLYYSGRLMEAYRQSLVNLQVAEKRQAKVKADYSLELAQEYFQWIGAKVSRATQEGLLAQAQEILSDARARIEKDLVTRLEVLNVEAQTNQARFQLQTAENDVTLARLKFIQRLGLTPAAVVEIPDRFEPPSKQPIDLEEALALAEKYRADIQVNTLLVRFHEYEERIAKAKGQWKVDLSGFAGTSAAAFETEPLNSGEDYFFGVKATRGWGLNSATTSVTTTKTSPRLGQTTRTDTTVYSAEVGIVDQLQGLNEVKQAQVNLEKARRDLEETRTTVVQEVQEALIGYQKALLQLEYAEQKIAFRQEQVKIVRAQASVNEALPSQLLEALMRLGDERVGQAQALSSVHVALARLNKAMGLPGHYR